MINRKDPTASLRSLERVVRRLDSRVEAGDMTAKVAVLGWELDKTHLRTGQVRLEAARQYDSHPEMVKLLKNLGISGAVNRLEAEATPELGQDPAA